MAFPGSVVGNKAVAIIHQSRTRDLLNELPAVAVGSEHECVCRGRCLSNLERQGGRRYRGELAERYCDTKYLGQTLDDWSRSGAKQERDATLPRVPDAT